MQFFFIFFFLGYSIPGALSVSQGRLDRQEFNYLFFDYIGFIELTNKSILKR